MLKSSSKMDLGNTKVLVVDDDLHALDLLVSVLSGFRIKQPVVCRDGEQACEAISRQAFDLIILDAEMPGEDGFSVLSDTRAKTKSPNFTAPIMMMSAHTSIDRVYRARNAGANIVIKKPIVPAILLKRIEWLARDRRDFVESDGFRGPDRRTKQGLAPENQERRADALALISDSNRALSQDDINSLFD